MKTTQQSQQVKLEDVVKTIANVIDAASGEKINGKMILEAYNAVNILASAASQLQPIQVELEAVKTQLDAEQKTNKSLKEQLERLKPKKK